MQRQPAINRRPFDERERQAEVCELGLSGRPHHDEYIDQLTRLAADLFAVPVALVTVIDGDYEWFVSACGLQGAQQSGCNRDITFCAHALQYDEIMLVPDTWEDPRFVDHPRVVRTPYFRFYAGALLRGPKGNPLGTLCLLDYVPRQLSRERQLALKRMAGVVETHLHRAGGVATTAQQERRPMADPETGIFHRDALSQRLAHMLDVKSVPTVAVFCVRLGNTAELRAGVGEETARAFLAAAGERLRSGLPAQVAIAQWDDGEFVLTAPTEVPGCRREELAERIESLLADPVVLGDMRIRPRVRIGISQVPDDGERSDVVIGLARSPERENLSLGSGSTSVEEGALGREAIQRRFRLIQQLERALSEDAIEAHLQPRIDLSSGLIVGAEALARWHDDALGTVSPQEFIPLAQRIGALDLLGQNVLGQVARLLARWRGTAAEPLRVAVNASAEEFVKPEFPQQVLAVLESEGVPCRNLELELTESALVTDFEMVRANMRILAEAGVRFAVDDFGIGYSSFQYLRQLPVHQLKIDRSFVRDSATDPDDARIVEAVVTLAHALGLEAVAEGVEHEDQSRFLRDVGCDQVQGFLFSAAQPQAEFSAAFRPDRYILDSVFDGNCVGDPPNIHR